MTKSALEGAQNGVTNAGRRREVPPGRTVELVRLEGDTALGKLHTVTFHVARRIQQVGPDPVISPLVGILRFGNGGTYADGIEVDVRNGTQITVPGGLINVSVRNDGQGTDETAPETFEVGAFVVEYPYYKPSNALRSIRISPLPLAAAGAESNLVEIPEMAQGVRLIYQAYDGPEKYLRFYDTNGFLMGEVGGIGNLAQVPCAIPNGARFVSVQNRNFGEIGDGYFMFDLSL